MINIILLLFVIVCLLLISGVGPPDSPWAPWWQIPDRITRIMCRKAKIDRTSVIYDLGCGTGRQIGIAAREFGARGVGIEIDPLRVILARWNIRRWGVSKRVDIRKENFFHIDFSPATVLFIYLIPPAIIRLTNKLVHELQPGTILISYRYEIPVEFFSKRLELIEHDKANKLFFYRVVEGKKKN